MRRHRQHYFCTATSEWANMSRTAHHHVRDQGGNESGAQGLSRPDASEWMQEIALVRASRAFGDYDGHQIEDARRSLRGMMPSDRQGTSRSTRQRTDLTTGERTGERFAAMRRWPWARLWASWREPIMSERTADSTGSSLPRLLLRSPGCSACPVRRPRPTGGTNGWTRPSWLC